MPHVVYINYSYGMVHPVHAVRADRSYITADVQIMTLPPNIVCEVRDCVYTALSGI